VRQRLIFLLLFLFIPLSFLAGEINRIVSLSPDITKSILLLGEEKKIVGVTRYSPIHNKPVIGSILQINIEKVVSLKPDLILATKEGNPKEVIEKLRSLKLKVIVLNEQKSIGDVFRNFLYLGEILDKEREAEKIINQVKEKLEKIKEKWKGKTPIPTFIQVGISPLVTVGSDTPLNEMLEIAGGKNIFSHLKRYPRINPEEVWRRNPRVYFVVSMGKKISPLFPPRGVKIYFLSAEDFASLTPVDVLKGVELIYHYLWEEKN